ncbi:hypothetical protein D9758_018167 [Tetrapyrgos nigripes]|uniref:Uncharacterized protein n=1 Tax=Tetrapyrgos nigripes TaxID=182062 RepID=A0A8H5BS14_9AGAR|nr:hypothetical protein D9758_018167 [Tetrapyrgos nigripes]
MARNNNSGRFNFLSRRRGAVRGYPNHRANTSSNASRSSTRGNNQAMPGPGQTTSNPSSSTSTSAPRENRRNVIFEDVSKTKFVGSNKILHTGDGQLPMEGFNGLSHVTFGKGFELTATGEGPDRPSSKPGVEMKYYCQVKDAEFEGVNLQFIGGKVVKAEERVLAPTTSSPQWSVAPRTQTYGGNAHNQPPNMHMHPQAQGSGWDQVWGGPSAPQMILYHDNQAVSMHMYPVPQAQGNGQIYGQDWGQVPWGGPQAPQVPMAWIQAGTTSAYYGPAPPGSMVQQSPHYSWPPQYQQ